MTTPTLLEASQAVVDKCDHGRNGAIVLPTFVITNLREAIEREKAKPEGVAEVINDLDAKMHAIFASRGSPPDCGTCIHVLGPMTSRCYTCGSGDLSNWEPKP